MPELPEVETIRLKLQKYLAGHKITDVEIRYGKKFTGNKNNVKGGRITAVRRFGKALAIDLNNGYSILIHIKMTGQLIYDGPNLKTLVLSAKVTGGVPGKHTHVIFHLDRGGKLYFNDVRKFGWIRIVRSDKVGEVGFVKELGPEPFKDFNFNYFKEILAKSNRAVKLTLMDQTKIGGVGNIYANDALWLARINPKRKGGSLKPEEEKELYDAIHKVLKEGIDYGGASENAYVTPDGREGDYQNHTLVYGREGELCGRCRRAKIAKFFLSGRGTYFCPNCQEN